MKRHRSKAVSLAMIPLLATSLTACGEDEEVAYCVTEDNEVVDDDNCGDESRGGGGGFFFLYAAGGFGRGQRIGSGTGTRIPSTDKAAVARRGGLGGSASRGGVGRSVSGSSGSGGGFSGGG